MAEFNSAKDLESISDLLSVESSKYSGMVNTAASFGYTTISFSWGKVNGSVASSSKSPIQKFIRHNNTLPIA